MSIFHYSEFLAIAWSNPKSLSTSSFILNHSLHYALAAISSWIEFLVEVNVWPEMKEYSMVTIVGVALCVGGELLRKLAIITAHTNFNHIVSNFAFCFLLDGDADFFTKGMSLLLLPVLRDFRKKKIENLARGVISFHRMKHSLCPQ